MAKEQQKTAPTDSEREIGDGGMAPDAENGELEMLVGKDKHLSAVVDRISTESPPTPKKGRGTIRSDLEILVPSPRPIEVVDGANVVAQEGSPYRTSSGMGSPGASGLHERRIDERAVPRVIS